MIYSIFQILKQFFVFFSYFLLRNLEASIGLRVKATKEETTIVKVKVIAVSLNNVPEIPSMKINGRKTATNTKVVLIIAKVYTLGLREVPKLKESHHFQFCDKLRLS